MTSLEIAEVTNKAHYNVLRDIDNIINELNNSKLSATDNGYESSTYIAKNGKSNRCYRLSKSATLVLITGYSAELRTKVINRWQYLEDQLEILKRKDSTKKHQINAMEALHDLLPDDLQSEAVSYIKANSVVNKATSTLFGFPKMLKKDQMSDEMLVMREKILDHYLMLYEFFEDNTKVAEFLFEKYQPNRIEHQEPVKLHVVGLTNKV